VGGVGALVNGAGSNTLTGDIILLADTTVGIPANGLTLSGAISGSGGLTVRGSTLTLSGGTPNTYAGPTILPTATFGSPGGFLRLSKSPGVNAVPGAVSIGDGSRLTTVNADQIPDTAPISVLGSGTLQPFAAETIGPLTMTGGFVNPVAGLTLNGDVTVLSGTPGAVSQWIGSFSLGAATRTIDVAAGSTLEQHSGTISGGSAAVGFNKTGGGLLTLEGTSTFTGASRVDGGVLRAIAAFPAPLQVGAGATLIGFGPYGNLTVAGGTLSPGDSPGFGQGGIRSGILASTGNVTFTPGSAFRAQLDGINPGSDYDQLKVSGSGTVDLGDARLDVDLGFTSAVNDVFTIVRNDTGNPTNGRFTRADGTRIEQGEVIVVAGQQFRINYSGGDFNDVILTHITTNPAFQNRAVTPVVPEGGVVTVTGTITEPDPLDTFILDVDWGDGKAETFQFGPGTPREVSVSHRYRDDTPSGTPADPYSIHLAWRDQFGGGNTGVLTTTVQNVAPVVTVGGDATIKPKKNFAREGSFSDPGADTWTATVDYGDGSGVHPLNLDGNGHFHLGHKYTRPGRYHVEVVVSDDDSGKGVAGFDVSVSGRRGVSKARAGRAIKAKAADFVPSRAVDALAALDAFPGTRKPRRNSSSS
jgi:autotransporter-associated beta strand protein